MKKSMITAVSCLAFLGTMQLAQANDEVLGVKCESPPPLHCAAGECATKIVERGNTKDALTGRDYFLDFPCDLKPDEKIVFILNIHGAGSRGNWQRHYFPAMDYKDKYRLVVATPTAAGPEKGVRRWTAEDDDAHLQNITNQVVEAFGAKSIKAFWLAGHSQGGMTSRRIVCSDFFANKVDGFMSLSGGRIGQAQIVAGFGPPSADGKPPSPRQRQYPPEVLPSCDVSHIYTTGAYEIEVLPKTSPWAEKYSCDARVEAEIVDTKAGLVYDSNRSGYPVWGREARPGTAKSYVYPNCKGGRVVADVVRFDKGHTEGLEPLVTEEIVKLMVSAKGGKISGD